LQLRQARYQYSHGGIAGNDVFDAPFNSL